MLCSNFFNTSSINYSSFRFSLLPGLSLLKNVSFNNKNKKKLGSPYSAYKIRLLSRQARNNAFKFYMLNFLFFNFRLVFKKKAKHRRRRGFIINKFFVNKKRLRLKNQFSFLKNNLKRILFLQLPVNRLLHKDYLKTSYALRLFKLLRFHPKVFSFVRTKLFRRKDKLSKFKYRIMRCTQRLK